MEGENSEEIKLKEKKAKKGKMVSPDTQNGSDADGSQTKMKKETKWKKVETEAKYEEDEGDQKKEKKKTKRKKHDSISSTIAMEEEDQMKKKKLVEYIVIKEENVTLNDESLDKNQRKKKLKDKSLQIKPENIKKEEAEEMQIVINNAKKPKKEKVKVLVAEPEEIAVVKEKVPVIPDGVNEIKAKKKAKVKESGMKVKETDVKLKRKKEKRKTEEFGNELKGMEDKKIIPRKKDKLIKEETVAEEETEVKTKKKSKKAKEEYEKEAEETEPKKKKKKVKEKVGVEDGSGQEPKISPPAEFRSKKSKTKKKSVKEDQDINTEAKAGGKKKKKMIKEEQKDAQDLPQVDVVFLSAKTGNTDEVSINQERRKNLQMEIDEESQPQKPTALGQWGTAQFDSSQQQQKFLRLMGGFKKGFQPAGATAGGANMALGKDAQQHLQQGLLGQFERAHARRMDFSNRGAGLGFSTPSNKKLSIDINVSRSIHFDD